MRNDGTQEILLLSLALTLLLPTLASLSPLRPPPSALLSPLPPPATAFLSATYCCSPPVDPGYHNTRVVGVNTKQPRQTQRPHRSPDEPSGGKEAVNSKNKGTVCRHFHGKVELSPLLYNKNSPQNTEILLVHLVRYRFFATARDECNKNISRRCVTIN